MFFHWHVLIRNPSTKCQNEINLVENSFSVMGLSTVETIDHDIIHSLFVKYFGYLQEFVKY